MKILHLLLLPLFTIIANLQAAEQKHPVAKRKRQPSYSHYILSSSYLNGLQEQSEQKLKRADDLYEAVETGTLSELDELLRKHPSECERFLGNYLEKPTRSPILHLAAVRGKPDIVRALLGFTTDINLPDETPFGNNNTPLHCAAQLRKPTRPQVCQILIAAGADVNIKNKLGKTPFYVACESSDNPYIAKLFLYHEADIDARTVQGQTPLHIAVAKGHIETVKLLLRCGARYRDTDYSNRTPMRIAEEKAAQYPNNPAYRDILTCLKDTDTFDAFVEDLFNFDEPANKRQRTYYSEQN